VRLTLQGVRDLAQDRVQISDRYQQCGLEGLTDRSRRPYRCANQLRFQVENCILNVKREHSSWGARKIREKLLRRFSGIPIQTKSTIHAVLDRYRLVERRGRVRHHAQGTALSLGQQSNELWCTDYKGEFSLGNHFLCKLFIVNMMSATLPAYSCPRN
jgi:putative transposase